MRVRCGEEVLEELLKLSQAGNSKGSLADDGLYYMDHFWMCTSHDYGCFTWKFKIVPQQTHHEYGLLYMEDLVDIWMRLNNWSTISKITDSWYQYSNSQFLSWSFWDIGVFHKGPKFPLIFCIRSGWKAQTKAPPTISFWQKGQYKCHATRRMTFGFEKKLLEKTLVP